MTQLNIITVGEFTQFAPEVDLSQYDQPTISGMIGQASQAITDILLYSPYAEDIVDEVRKGIVRSNGDLIIYPSKLPIATISGVSIARGATTLTVNINSGTTPRYNIDFNRRKVTFPWQEMLLQGTAVFTNFYALRGSDFYTKLTYRGGWEPSALPQTIKQACVLLVRDLLTPRYNQMGASRIQQGSLSFSYSAGSNSQEQSKFYKDAKRLLAPYVRIG